MPIDSRKVIEELARRHTDQKSLQPAVKMHNKGFMKSLFPLQREIIEDSTPVKILFAGRRGSKTHIMITAMFDVCTSTPEANAVFIGISKAVVKRQIWRDIKRLNKRFSLGLKFNGVDLIATFPNSSTIWLAGRDKQDDVEKIRGDHFHIACVDELQKDKNTEWVDYFINEVLGPALDEHDATLYLAGTPNRSCTGYFYNITTSPVEDYQKVWHFTMMDNPEYPLWAGDPDWRRKAKEHIEMLKHTRYKHRQGAFNREFLALWERDEESSVLKFSDTNNTYDSLPQKDWNYIIGVDFGVDDEFCVVLCAWATDDPNFYVENVYKQSHLSYKQQCSAIMRWVNKYDPSIIVGDPGGGALIIQDLAERYDIPIEAAKKREKAEFIDLFGDDVADGLVKINAKLTTVIEELKNLSWIDKAKMTMRGLDHAFDAIRYAWRESQHYLYKPVEPIDYINERLNKHVENLIRGKQKSEWQRSVYEY